MELKIGLVGLGVISGAHLAAIRANPSARLTAVCDILPEKRSLAPEAAFYTDLEEMLRKERLDCLHICLPHHLHVPAALAAAKRGVHVFLEKPAALNGKQLATLETVEATFGVKLGICLQNRYNASTTAIRKVLDDGSCGRLLGCKAIVTWRRGTDYYTKDAWRGLLAEAGGGVMLSQAIHTLDLMCYLCGEAQWVKGMAANLLLEDIEVEDTAMAHIRFQDDVQGIFFGTVTHTFDSPIELELIFEAAILSLREGVLIQRDANGMRQLAADCSIGGSKSYYGAGHPRAIAAFYDAILHGDNGYISVADAAASIHLIDAIVVSSRTGKRAAP